MSPFAFATNMKSPILACLSFQWQRWHWSLADDRFWKKATDHLAFYQIIIRGRKNQEKTSDPQFCHMAPPPRQQSRIKEVSGLLKVWWWQSQVSRSQLTICRDEKSWGAIMKWKYGWIVLKMGGKFCVAWSFLPHLCFSWFNRWVSKPNSCKWQRETIPRIIRTSFLLGFFRLVVLPSAHWAFFVKFCNLLSWTISPLKLSLTASGVVLWNSFQVLWSSSQVCPTSSNQLSPD